MATAGFAQHEHHGAGKYAALVSTSAECASAADVCVAHCEDLISQGDKTLARCLKTAAQVAIVCDSLRSLAARNADLTPQMATVAFNGCKDCEAECRKHEKTHAVCKACGDACAACATECEKVKAV
jgi:Cys-rich four helix bundle protein (predicted Tat secretion target)